MKRTLTLFGALALIAAAAYGAAAKTSATRPAAERVSTWDDYQIIVSRNMFSKDRARWRPSSYVPSSRPAVSSYVSRPREERTGYILTGIGHAELQRVAFFEDTSSGSTVRAWVGQALDKGYVTAITLDSVVYQRNGVVRRIEIGQNLSGAIVGVPADGSAIAGMMPTTGPASTQPTSEPTGATSAPAGASPPGNTAADSIEERLRQRRAKELKE